MLRVYSISLGCPKNLVDSERLLGSLGKLRHVTKITQADLVFINTCSFIQSAVQESVRVILDAAENIKKLPLKKRPLLAVAGCLVSRYHSQGLANEIPEVDLWLNVPDLERWPSLIGETFDFAPVPGRLLSTGPGYAYLKISDGCNHTCAFCTIPFIRGPLRSFPEAQLLKEAQTLIETDHVREIILVGQDVTGYGRDAGKTSALRSLLSGLVALPGLNRLRLMYLYPAGLTREFLTFLRDLPPVFVPYFDIPLQHSHPDVLIRMGRPFAQNPDLVLARVRDLFPEAALRTSLIVGYPGETQSQFEHLLDFVQASHFQHLGVFAYEAEEDTPAADLPEQIPEEVRQERYNQIMSLQAEISAELLEAHLGRHLDILVEKVSPEWPGLHVGRAWFQAPEVDGVTYISGPGVSPGALVRAEITETHTYDLSALTE
jgi:tRNA-2-methylthio-N6-dimethylallyladenosine synthase/ribosomal protein S12 methylthiotransferase